jgi:hypothetical protein
MEFTQINFAVMIINNKEVLHRHRLKPSLTITTINEMFVVIDNNHHRIPIKDRTLMDQHRNMDQIQNVMKTMIFVHVYLIINNPNLPEQHIRIIINYS